MGITEAEGKILARLDAKTVITAIGYRLDTLLVTDDRWKCFCPIHKENVFRSLSVNPVTRQFRCGFAQCQGSRGGDFITLYSLAKGITREEAVEFWEENFGFKVRTNKAKTPDVPESTESQTPVGKPGRPGVKVEPQSLPSARAVLAEYHRQRDLGHRDSALDGVRKVLQRFPDDLDLLEAEAEGSSNLGDSGSAKAALRRMAMVYHGTGATEGEIRVLKRVVQLDLEDPESYEALAGLCLDLGLREEAVEALYGAAGLSLRQGRREEALVSYRRIVAVSSEETRAQKSIADLEKELGNVRAAAEALLTLARTYVAKEILGKATETYQSVLEIDPHSREAHCELADLLDNRGLGSEAGQVRSSLADLLIAEDCQEDAALVLERVVRENPRDVEARQKLALLYRHLGRPADARLQYTAIGETFEKQGAHGKAIKLYSRLHEEEPTDREVLDRLVDLHVARGDREEAVKTLLAQAKTDRERGEDRLVLDDLRRALDLDPEGSATALAAIEFLYETPNAQAAEEFIRLHVGVLESRRGAGPALEFLESLPEGIRSLPCVGPLIERITPTQAQPVDPATEMRKARECLSEGLHDRARRHYETALDLGAPRRPVLRELLQIGIDLRDRVRVAAVLPELLETREENGSGSIGIEVCTTLLRTFARDALIRSEVLGFLESAPFDENPLEAVREIASSSDSTPEIVEWLIGRYVAAGRTGEASDFLKFHASSALERGDSEAAVRYLDRLVNLDPQNLESQRSYAAILTDLDRKEEAAQTWTAIGKREQEKGSSQEAHDCFGKALAIMPDWLPALREDFQVGLDAGEVSWVIPSTERLAQAYVEQDLFGKARETLQLALRRFPNETQLIRVVINHLRRAGATDRAADLALKLADLHWSNDQREEALDIYSEVAEFMPDNLHVWEKKASVEREIFGYPACLATSLRLVDLYREKGLHGKRVEALEKLRTEYPESSEIWEENIKALEETGNRERLAKTLQDWAQWLSQHEKATPRARRNLERALEISPENVAILTSLAEMCRAEKDDAATLTHLGGLCEILHTDPLPEDPKAIGLLESSYRSIIEISPMDPEPRLRFAALLKETGKGREAASLLREFVGNAESGLSANEEIRLRTQLGQIQPEDTENQLRLAALYQQEGDPERERRILGAVVKRAVSDEDWPTACEVLSRIADLSPHSAEIWESLAKVAHQAGDQERFLVVARKAGNLHLERGTFDKARQLFEWYLREGGEKDFEIVRSLARVYDQAGDLELAADFLMEMADYLEKEGDLSTAADAVRRACEIAPDRKSNVERLAKIFVLLGQTAQAARLVMVLMRAAPEEEAGIRLIDLALEWQEKTPSFGLFLLEAFRNVDPELPMCRRLVTLIARLTDDGEPAARTLSQTPEQFLRCTPFWLEYLVRIGGDVPKHHRQAVLDLLVKGEHYREALSVCRAALEKEGDRADLLEEMATVQRSQDDKASLLETLSKTAEIYRTADSKEDWRRVAAEIAEMDPDAPEALCLAEMEEAAKSSIDPTVEARALALQYAEAGSPHDAIVQWNVVLSHHPGDIDAHARLWELYVKIGDLERAAAGARHLADAASLRGDSEEALAWLDRILESVPESIPTGERAAEICLGMGDTDRAVRYLTRLVRVHRQNHDDEAEIRTVERIRVLDPEQADLERLGRYYEEADPARAVDAYLALLDRAEAKNDEIAAAAAIASVERLSGQRPEDVATLAERLERRGDTSGAARMYRRAGEVFSKQGERIRAIEHFRSAVALGVGDPALALQMADLYASFGNLVEVESCLWLAWEGLQKEGSTEDLVAVGQRILAIGSSDSSGQARIVAHVDSLGEKIKPDVSEEIRASFLTVLSRYPDSPRTVTVLGELLDRWKSHVSTSLETLCNLGERLSASGSPRAVECGLVVASRAWETGDEESAGQSLRVLRGFDLSRQDRGSLIAIWRKAGREKEVLPEMSAQLEALERADHPEEALVLVDEILKIDPENGVALDRRPSLLAHTGARYESGAARIEFAEWCLRTGRKDRAAQAAHEVLSNFNQEETLLASVADLFDRLDDSSGLNESTERIADLCVERGEYDRAIGKLEKLASRVGITDRLLEHVAKIAVIQGDREKILGIRLRLARHYRSNDEFGRAIEVYREITTSYPDQADVRVEMAHLLWDKGFPEDAKRELAKAVGRLQEEGQWDEARKQADLLVDWAPEDQSALELAVDWAEREGVADRIASSLRRYGNGLRKEGALGKAVEVFRRLLENAPEDFEAHEQWVECLLDLDRRREACRELTSMARSCRDRGEMERALAAAGKALSIIPETGEAAALVVDLSQTEKVSPDLLAAACRALARSAVEMESYEEARRWIARGKETGELSEDFRGLEELVSSREEARLSAAGLDEQARLAGEAIRNGDAERGRGRFDSLLDRHPSDLNLVSQYVEALEQAGLRDDAIRTLDRKAEMLERVEDFGGARFCIERLLSIRPDSLRDLVRHGRLSILVNDEEGAWTSLSSALDLLEREPGKISQARDLSDVLEEFVARAPHHPMARERAVALAQAMGDTERAVDHLAAIHQRAHREGRALEALEALKRSLAFLPVRVPKSRWKIPEDWLEKDDSIEWVLGADAEESLSGEDARPHIRMRERIANYDYEHGVAAQGTRESLTIAELARIYGDQKLAVKAYRRVLRYLKDLPGRSNQRIAWEGLFEVEFGRGDRESLRKVAREWAAWEEDSKDYERALSVRREFLRVTPRDVSMREDLIARAWEWGYADLAWDESLILAEGLKERDLFGRAEALYRGLLQRCRSSEYGEKLLPKRSSAVDRLVDLLRDRGDVVSLVEFLSREARTAAEARDFETAIRRDTEVLSLREKDLSVREHLTQCLMNAGRKEESLAELCRLAEGYREAGLTDKSLEAAQKALGTDPENGDYLTLCSKCHRDAGRSAEAVEFYWDRVARLTEGTSITGILPVDTTPKVGGHGQDARGTVRGFPAEGKRREAAKRYLEEIENLCDPQPAAMVRLAEAWAGFGTIEKAADLFTRAGELKLAEGDIQGARDLLNRALTLDPKHPAALAGVKRIETEYAEEMRSARRNDLLTSANNAEKNDRVREACDILTTYLAEFPEDIERKERWVELMISRTGGKGRLGESVSALSEEERDTLFGICTSVSEENRNRGELARSVHYLRIALDLRPEDEVLCRNLMDRCVELGLTGDAVRLGTELAGRFMRRGDAARAANIYRSLLDLDPENLDVRSELATALAEAGRPDEAKQAFAELSRVCVGRELVNQAVSALQSALRIDETDLDLRHMLGRAYGMKGDTGAAVAELDRVERTYRERGELLSAVAILREMVYLDPERGSLRARLGQTLVDAGRSAEAFDVYRDLALFYRARELPGKMIEAAMAALGIRPDDVPMSRLVVETYRDRGETNRAIGEAHRLAELLARSDPDSAENVYRDVLTWCPEDAASYAALAQLAESQGKTREASDHHENLGRVLRSEGRFLEACSAWADALRNNDRKIALKEELVELYLDVGDEYHSNLLLEEIAEHYEKVGDYDEAVNRWLELADRNIQKAMDMSA